MSKTYDIKYTEAELPAVAKELLVRYGNRPVWAFYAPMGAGKTTLIKALCVLLGVNEDTASPTFAIVNEYHGNKGSIYHFDCYRLDTLADAYAMGAEEYLESGSPCFVEWPEVLEEILPADAVVIRIAVVDNHTRTLQAT